MLARILEPEVMDTSEEASDYDAMDHSEVNRLFVADFLEAWDGRSPILDVGTGTAQIPIALCLANRKARVIAIDLAEEMLQVGRNNVLRAGLDQRLTLERQDAKKLPYPNGSFGSIISNSIVHHIPNPAPVFAEMVRVASSGALLFVRDLLRPNDEPALKRLVQMYAGDANPHQQKMFSDSLHAALSLEEVRSLVAALGFDSFRVHQTTDRHWTWSAKKV